MVIEKREFFSFFSLSLHVIIEVTKGYKRVVMAKQLVIIGNGFDLA